MISNMEEALSSREFSVLWGKLAASKEYRDAFASMQVKRAIPAQIRALMHQKEISQQDLADASALTQGVISRAANPNYGNLALNTIIKIAAGLDLAFIGEFVPFSRLCEWTLNWSDDKLGMVPSFENEAASIPETFLQPVPKLIRQRLKNVAERRRRSRYKSLRNYFVPAKSESAGTIQQLPAMQNEQDIAMVAKAQGTIYFPPQLDMVKGGNQMPDAIAGDSLKTKNGASKLADCASESLFEAAS